MGDVIKDLKVDTNAATSPPKSDDEKKLIDRIFGKTETGFGKYKLLGVAFLLVIVLYLPITTRAIERVTRTRTQTIGVKVIVYCAIMYLAYIYLRE